jgi:hypothetical protein
MKKFTAVLLPVLVLSLVVFGGFGGAVKAEASDIKMDLSITGGSIGGAWAAIGEGVAEVIRRSYPGSSTAYEVGQEAANIVLVSKGKAQLGIAHAQLINLGMKGYAPFREKYDNLRALTVLYSEAVEHFIIRRETGIESFEQIKEEKYPLKLNLNTKDSFMEIVGRKVLEAYDITYEDIKEWGGSVDFMNMTSSLDLMRDGRLDAFSNVIQVPSSHVVNVATTIDIDLLGMSEKAQAKVNDELGTYPAVIPKDKYTFLEEDVPTVGASVILFTNKDLPEEEAYAILKSIYENFDYFKNIHASLNSLTLEDMQETSPVPLHQGAEKFYSEFFK